ncbi:MAG TPA: alpha/beta hydrolase [Polyangiaceae bacterium]|nr:alpha/beta hydrolase [Polyangiaceae bacterium]
MSFGKTKIGLCSIAVIGVVACSSSNNSGSGTAPDLTGIAGAGVGGTSLVSTGGTTSAGATPGAGGTTVVDTGGGGTSVVGTGGTSVIGTGGISITGTGGVGTGGTSSTGTGGDTSSGGTGAAGAGGDDTAGNGGVGGGGGTAGASGGGTGPAPTSDSATAKGTCMVQQYTMGIPTAADYATPTVYYPTVSADCPAPFPGVVIIPGFTEKQNSVSQWGTFLASHGFAVMLIDSAANGMANTGVEPMSRAQGLAEGVTTLKGENTRSGSPLSGKLDGTRMAIMGHSMGGGGTLIAANMHPELKAAIGLCPWNPGGTYPMDTVATLFFDGSADPLVPPSAATAEYMSIPTTTHKTYAEFNGGSHLVANTPLGNAATDKVVARIGLSWLEVYVVGDTRYQQFIAKDPSMSAYDSKP